MLSISYGRMGRNGIILAMGAALLIAAPDPGFAASPYRIERDREWTVIGTGLALGLTGLWMVTRTEPLGIDELDQLDLNDVNGFDRGRVEPLRDDHAGDALAVISYLMPLAFFAHEDTRNDWQDLGVMWTEATLLNLGINGVVKAAVLRPRPYAYDPDVPMDKRTSRGARFSYYSGHTASAAMNSFFVAQVFSDYLDNGNVEAALWAGAVLYPVAAGFFRVDSGHHFTTDAITGYVIGAAIGVLVPRLHRHDDKDQASLEPVMSQGGFGLGLSFAF